MNPADNTDDCAEIHEVSRAFRGRVLPKTTLVLCCVTGLDVCKEDGYILREVYLGGSWEVELDHTLKFAKEGLLDELLWSIVFSIGVNKTFILS